MNELTPFLEAAVRTATPLLLAALGELIVERAGVINLGLEGCMIAGAYAAFVASGSSASGYAAATAAGLAIGLIMVCMVVVLRRDQIIVGTALTILALGVTGALFRAREETTALVAVAARGDGIPLLADIPVLGPALFMQPMITYLAIALVPVLWWWLGRTHAGVALRAVGEAPSAALASGVHVQGFRAAAVLVGAALGGIAGGALVLAQAGSFAENMTAGRGFLAVAVVALGRWHPGGVALASFVFGSAMALQYVVQALGWSVRYELVLMIPYVLTLVALGAFGRGSAPAFLGRRLDAD